jgi:hypothetical protein
VPNEINHTSVNKNPNPRNRKAFDQIGVKRHTRSTKLQLFEAHTSRLRYEAKKIIHNPVNPTWNVASVSLSFKEAYIDVNRRSCSVSSTMQILTPRPPSTFQMDDIKGKLSCLWMVINKDVTTKPLRK